MKDRINPKECRVALLYGGVGGEREVSLASREGAEQALIEAGFQVKALDPSCKEDLKALIDGNFNVAFICLHGEMGEDGSIQGFLNTIGMPYIGSGVLASALAMNKTKAKVFFKQAGLLTPPEIHLQKGEEIKVQDIISQLGNHVVIKPCCEGSALGVFIVEGQQAIDEAIKKVRQEYRDLLIETYIAGKELTASVIESDTVCALPIIEIIPTSEFYDYRSKYEPGGSQHICPANLSALVTQQIKDMAVKAHQVLGCEGISRSDFILDKDNRPWILETNTIPGMTATSLIPDSACQAGLSFSELCTLLIEKALR